jgi:hypothetical protein
MNKNKNSLPFGCLFYLFGAGGFAVIFVIGAIVSSVRDAVLLGPFNNYVSEYSSISGFKNPVKGDRSSTKPYIKGKVITINKQENRIDSIYYDLPEDLRATKPDEVGTIAWLEWGEDKIGTYTDGDDAIVITCQVTVIDKSIPRIVSKTNFEGIEPPRVKRSSESGTGPIPTQKIVDYLRDLPKK